MLARQTIAVSLAGLLLFGLFYNTAVWVHYELHVDEITELFCINKDKPELQCNGQCHLAQELIALELLTELPDEPLREAVYMPALKQFVSEERDFALTLLAGSGTASSSYYIWYWNSLSPDPPFHPPRV